MNGRIRKILLLLVCLAALPAVSRAQFKEEAFNQSYVNPADSTAQKDSVDKMWTFREFYRGVTHKDSLRIGSMFAGATVFIGAEQIYNRQYWKLPIVYGGLGATVGLGFHFRQQYKADETQTHAKDMATLMFASAGLIYWGTLMDGVVNYKRDVPNQPGKATLYSILLPGLGQAYNGEYWKIPIYWGGLIGSYHFYSTNNTNYKRYKRIHNEATNPEVEYTGAITAERAVYYRDVFRRFRDYSTVAMIGFYLLQVIDANVFAYMQDFEVNDDLSMRVTPTVITPYTNYAMNTGRDGAGFRMPSAAPGAEALGMRIGFTF